MQRTSKILETVLICSLMASIGSVGFCSCPALALNSHCGSSAATSPRSCCCTAGAVKSCGMACCLTPASRTLPADVPARPASNAHDVQLALQTHALAVTAGGIDVGRAHGGHSSDSPLAVSSLQMQHVRIQT